MWKTKSKVTFILILLISGIVILQLGLHLSHLLFQTSFQVNIFRYCLNIIQGGTEGHLFFKLTFTLLIGYTLLFVLWRAIKQFVLSQEASKRIDHLQSKTLTLQMNHNYLREKQHIIVIQSTIPSAFTIGLFRPKIILSTGLIELLDESEIRAVILHEEFHQKNFDPLKVFVITLFSDGIPFVPIIKGLVQYYKIARELLADQYAIQKMGSTIGLGSALLKIMRNGENIQSSGGVSLTDTAVNYRIMQILDPDKDVHLPTTFELRSTLTSIVILLILVSIVLGGCS